MSSTRLRIGIPLLVAFVVSMPIKASPLISEEVSIDTGYRYWYGTGWPETAVQGISEADSTLLEIWQDNSVAYAMRRGPNGEEVDRSPVYLGEGGRFDISDRDPIGWKFAYTELSDPLWTKLIVANLDSHTLAVTDTVVLRPRGGPVVSSTQIARGDGFHAVAWVEGARPYHLRLQRISQDMTRIDPAPVPVDSMLQSQEIRLAMTATHGILAYVDHANRVVVRRLGSDGLPVAGPQVVGTGQTYYPPQMDVCPYGRGWLVAWDNSDNYLSAACLDSSGTVEPPGVITTQNQPYHGGGLAVAANDDLGLVAWRTVAGNSGGTVYAVRVARGIGILGLPIALDTNSPDPVFDEPRDLSARWTGSSFGVMWVSSGWPITGRPAGGTAPAVAARSGGSTHGPEGEHTMADYASYPTLSQWIGADGTVLYPSALKETLSAPGPLLFGDNGRGEYLAVVKDGSGDTGEFLHMAPFASDGSQVGPWIRSQIADIQYCQPLSCDEEWTSGVSLRSCRDAQAVTYVHNFFHSSDTYDARESNLRLKRIGNDGSVQWTKDYGPGYGGEVQSYDVAPGSNRSVLFSTTTGMWDEPPEIGHVAVLRQDGTVSGSWGIETADQVHTITAVRLPADSTKCLVVWREDGPGLHVGIFDTDAPGTLQGSSWAVGYSSFGTPRLISSPDRILCVFPADSGLGNGYDIFGTRFDANGTRLDYEPFRICGLAGNQGNVAGAWEGNHFLVTYGTDWPHPILYGNRISAGRLVIDGDGFQIAEGFSSASVASTGEGSSLVAYGGNRMRRIDATATPVLLSGLDAQVLGADVKLTWWAMDGVFDSFIVTRVEAGAPVQVGLVPAHRSDSNYEWTDAGVAPGDQEYQVEGTRRDGIVERLGPIVVRVAGGPRASSLRAIGTPGVGSIRLRMEAPRGATAMIHVFDVQGRCIRTLGPVGMDDGRGDLVWDGKALDGRPSPTGVYWFQAQCSLGKSARCRAVLIR